MVHFVSSFLSAQSVAFISVISYVFITELFAKNYVFYILMKTSLMFLAVPVICGLPEGFSISYLIIYMFS